MRVHLEKCPTSKPCEILAHVKVSKRDHPPEWKYSHSFKFVTSSDSGHVSIYSSKEAATAGKSKEKCDFDPEKFFGEINSKSLGRNCP